MPIGNILRFGIGSNRYSAKRLIKTLYFTLYGTPDLHTHIRWRIIKRFIDVHASLVLDVGCGIGLIALELALKRRGMKIIGIDIDQEAIDRANLLKEKLRITNAEFHHCDVRTLPFHDQQFDMVLLIDVIEHVQNPEMILENISRLLKPSGVVIVSVPTPNYPKFFGYEFHKEIGHVRDGYWHDEIIEMMDHYNIRVTVYQYYTYYPSSLVCSVYYRFLRKSKLGIALSPVLNLVSYLDWIWPVRQGDFACSLVVKGQKEK